MKNKHIGGDVLKDIEKQLKKNPALRAKVEAHTKRHEAKIAKRDAKGAALIHRGTFASDKEFERFKKNMKAQKYADKLAKKKRIKTPQDFGQALDGIKLKTPAGLFGVTGR